MMMSTLGLGALVHCGESLEPRNQDEPPDGSPPTTNDAGRPDADVVSDGGDGSSASGPCLWNAPFTAPPTRLATINTTDVESDPRLSDDELIIYFSRAAGTSPTRIFASRRASLTDGFGPATEVTDLNPPNPGLSVVSPAPSSDDLMIVFSRGIAPAWDLVVATRSSKVGSWGAADAVPFLNQPASAELNGYLLPDKQTLYFASNRGPSGQYQIYRATIGDDAGASLVTIPGIDASAVGALEPVVSEDQLTMWFGRRGPIALKEDIWVTHRLSPNNDAPFGDPIEITALTTADRDMPGFISKDLCRLYFSRQVSATDIDLFVAVRAP
jgi:hypothetical protein